MHALEDLVQQRSAEVVSLHRWDRSKAKTFSMVTYSGRVAEDRYRTFRNAFPTAPSVELTLADNVSTREQAEAAVNCSRPIKRHDVASVAMECRPSLCCILSALISMLVHLDFIESLRSSC